MALKPCLGCGRLSRASRRGAPTRKPLPVLSVAPVVARRHPTRRRLRPMRIDVAARRASHHPLVRGGQDHPNNLETLCARCHGRETAAEQRGAIEAISPQRNGRTGHTRTAAPRRSSVTNAPPGAAANTAWAQLVGHSNSRPLSALTPSLGRASVGSRTGDVAPNLALLLERNGTGGASAPPGVPSAPAPPSDRLRDRRSGASLQGRASQLSGS